MLSGVLPAVLMDTRMAGTNNVLKATCLLGIIVFNSDITLETFPSDPSGFRPRDEIVAEMAIILGA